MIDLAIDTRVFIDTALDAAIQELDILFNTENTELIGYPEYGTNWLQFLWQLDPSPQDLQHYIYEKLSDTYFVEQMNPDINVHVLEDDSGDLIYIVEVYLTDGVNERTKSYRLS